MKKEESAQELEKAPFINENHPMSIAVVVRESPYPGTFGTFLSSTVIVNHIAPESQVHADPRSLCSWAHFPQTPLIFRLPIIILVLSLFPNF